MMEKGPQPAKAISFNTARRAMLKASNSGTWSIDEPRLDKVSFKPIFIERSTLILL